MFFNDLVESVDLNFNAIQKTIDLENADDAARVLKDFAGAVDLSMNAIQKTIHKEKIDREKAGADILRTVNNQLQRERALRQQSDYEHLDELNAAFEEHIQNFLAEKNNVDLYQGRIGSANANGCVHKSSVPDATDYVHDFIRINSVNENDYVHTSSVTDENHYVHNFFAEKSNVDLDQGRRGSANEGNYMHKSSVIDVSDYMHNLFAEKKNANLDEERNSRTNSNKGIEADNEHCVHKFFGEKNHADFDQRRHISENANDYVHKSSVTDGNDYVLKSSVTGTLGWGKIMNLCEAGLLTLLGE